MIRVFHTYQKNTSSSLSLIYRIKNNLKLLQRFLLVIVNHVNKKRTDVLSEGPEEICLSLEHQNPSKTSEKMGYFDRVTVSLHILYTANQETEGSQDRLTV